MTVPFNTSNMAGVNYNYVYTPPATGAYNYGTSNPDFAVGQLSTGSDGSVWVYCKIGTGGATALGYVMVIDEDYLAVMMSNSVGAAGDRIGVFAGNSAAIANDYAWLQIYGTCDAVQVLASAAANVPLASTTTAGALDDATGTGTKNITGLVLTTARAASQGNAPAELNWPIVGTTN